MTSTDQTLQEVEATVDKIEDSYKHMTNTAGFLDLFAELLPESTRARFKQIPSSVINQNENDRTVDQHGKLIECLGSRNTSILSALQQLTHEFVKVDTDRQAVSILHVSVLELHDGYAAVLYAAFENEEKSTAPVA